MGRARRRAGREGISQVSCGLQKPVEILKKLSDVDSDFKTAEGGDGAGWGRSGYGGVHREVSVEVEEARGQPDLGGGSRDKDRWKQG